MARYLLLIIFAFCYLTKSYAQFSGTFCGENSVNGLSKFNNLSASASSNIPNTGTFRTLIILCKFSDDTFDRPPWTDLWPHTLNAMPSWGPSLVSPTVQTTYSDPSESGYFKLMSSGLYNVIGDVIFYQPQHPESYYYFSNGKGVNYLTEEILTAIDPYVNYVNYDNNHDGKVDMIQICFRFAPYNELDAGGGYEGIASLTGHYSTFGSGASYLTMDGVKIYAGYPGSGTLCQDVISLDQGLHVMTHEFGHYLFGFAFGGNTHLLGTFKFGLMEAAGGGHVMNGLERELLGWINPQVVTNNLQNQTINDAVTTGNIYKVIDNRDGNYYYVENHEGLSYYENSWTEYNGGPIDYPGTGILITKVTGNSYHYLDIVCADGLWDWQKSGGLYVYPFQHAQTDPLNGQDEMDLYNVATTSGTQSAPNYMGDSDDLFKIGNNIQFSPGSNPSSGTNFELDVIDNDHVNINLNNITISQNTTFYSGTYVFNSNIIVNPNVTLTINPGAIFTFNNGSSLIVNGTLNAQGTSTSPSTLDFVSQNPSTKNGIIVNQNGVETISYATIKNAYNGDSIIASTYPSSIQNSIIQNCYNGIVVRYASKDADLTINNNIIQSTTNFGISVTNPGYGMNSEPSISNNNITGGNYEIYLNNVRVTIQSSTLQSCTQGIWVYNSAPHILNNHITDPVQNGIYINASGDAPEILSNAIIKNSTNPQYHQYQGIYSVSNSTPFISQNDIQGFNYGMYLGGGTNATFTNSSYTTLQPNNRLTNNNEGLIVAWGSYTLAGNSLNTGWDNSIYGNPTADLDVYNSSTVYAENNFWGNPFIYFVDNTSSAYFYPMLSSDPWIGFSLKISQPPIVSANKFPSYKILSKNNNVSGSEFNSGIQLEKQGDIDGAINFYKQCLSNVSIAEYALTKLAYLKNRYDRPDIKTYFESLLTTSNQNYAPVVINLLARMYLKEGQYDKAVALWDGLILKYPNSYYSWNAKFDELFAAQNYKNDLTRANQIFTEIKNANLTNDYLLKAQEIAQFALNSGSGSGIYKNYYAHNNYQNLPAQYSLSQNYPNPFNPSTIIHYEIPNDGLVILKVYDELGKEVMTLINRYERKGRYDVTFNASQLPSGIYFYQIRTNDYLATKKMLLLK